MSGIKHRPPQLPIMAHLVLGYPTLEESIRTAERYIAAGMAILELQIPFSHPTADGPVITAACQRAIEQNVTVTDCLRAIGRLREKYPEQEMVVMSYLNRVYVYGFEKFRAELAVLGVRHFIVPDFPAQTPIAIKSGLPEGKNLFKLDFSNWAFDLNKTSQTGNIPFKSKVKFEKVNLKNVHALKLLKLKAGAIPVLAANTPNSRLAALLGAGYNFFYLMSDFKITGSTFSLHPRLQEMVAQIKSHSPQNRVGIGFGIETPEQVLAVLEVADFAIIGSALIRTQQEGRLDDYLENMRNALSPTTMHL